MHNVYVNSMLKWNDGMQHSQTACGRAWWIKGLYTDGHPGSCSLVSRLRCIAPKCDIIHPLHLRLRNLVCDVWNVRRCMVYCMWEAMFSKVYHPIGIPCYIVFSISGTGCKDTSRSSSWQVCQKTNFIPPQIVEVCNDWRHGQVFSSTSS